MRDFPFEQIFLANAFATEILLFPHNEWLSWRDGRIVKAMVYYILSKHQINEILTKTNTS